MVFGVLAGLRCAIHTPIGYSVGFSVSCTQLEFYIRPERDAGAAFLGLSDCRFNESRFSRISASG